MRAMLDHIMLRVRDYQASRHFYDVVLGTLGYQRLMEFQGGAGYGPKGKPYFWIGSGADPQSRTHIAFLAKDRAAVDAFHAAALKLGARSDGAPGVRKQYHPSYYGSFVFDPDGHNIEAVCHAPVSSARGAMKSTGAATKAAPAKAKPAKTTVMAKPAKAAAQPKKPAPRRR